MATTLKVLGQLSAAAAQSPPETLYTVPGSTTAVVSSVSIVNRSTTATSFRLVVSVAGAAINDKQYLAYDVPIGSNETVVFTLGITLGAADVLKAYAAAATLTFQAFGQENT